MQGEDKRMSAGVCDYLTGRSVLITGFSGLLGKLVAEKLLRSCPQIDKIYVLIRSKRNLSPEERLEKITRLLCFDAVRETNPDALRKLVAVGGDLSLEGLGLSEQDRAELCRHVSVVFHSAASVRFDDSLPTAVVGNMVGTKRLLDLSLDMVNLQCFLHVSTAYSNCDESHMKEAMYPPKMDWRQLIAMVQNLDTSSVQTLSNKLMGEIPNTYVFTKGLTEHIVNDYGDRLPVAIVRPSLVVPAFEEPVPGWIDNRYGPLGANVGLIAGICHCVLGQENGYVNYVYTDFVVKSIILAACHKTNSMEEPGRTPVYNACSPPSHKYTNKEYAHIHKYGPTEKFLDSEGINYFSFKYIKSPRCFNTSYFIRHMISAFLIDTILFVMGKTPMLWKIRRGAYIGIERLGIFLSNSIDFEVDQFLALSASLSDSERQVFGYDFNGCDMRKVYHDALLLSKKVLLKPLFDHISMARSALKWLNILDKGAVIGTYSLFLYLIYKWNLYSLPLTTILNFLTISC